MKKDGNVTGSSKEQAEGWQEIPVPDPSEPGRTQEQQENPPPPPDNEPARTQEQQEA